MNLDNVRKHYTFINKYRVYLKLHECLLFYGNDLQDCRKKNLWRGGPRSR